MRAWGAVVTLLVMGWSSAGLAQEDLSVEEVTPESGVDGEAGAGGEDPPPGEARTGDLAGPEAQSSEPAPAPAEVDPSVVTARRHYAQGVAFFRTERYPEAIAEFTEAYSLWPNPTILYSLGQANERLLRVPHAMRYYRRFLADAPADDERRVEVELKLRALERLLGTVTIASNVPAEIWANDERVGDAPGEVRLTTGSYTIELRADDYETSAQDVVIAAETTRELSFVLERAQPRQLVIEGSLGIEPVWFWITGSLTVATAIGAAALGGVTLRLADDYDRGPTRDAQNFGRQMALATDITIGVAGTLAIATFILGLVTDWGGEAEESPEALTAHLRGDGFEVVW